MIKWQMNSNVGRCKMTHTERNNPDFIGIKWWAETF